MLARLAVIFLLLFAFVGPAAAQGNSAEQLVDDIIRDVVNRTMEAARREAERATHPDVYPRSPRSPSDGTHRRDERRDRDKERDFDRERRPNQGPDANGGEADRELAQLITRLPSSKASYRGNSTRLEMNSGATHLKKRSRKKSKKSVVNFKRRWMRPTPSLKRRLQKKITALTKNRHRFYAMIGTSIHSR